MSVADENKNEPVNSNFHILFYSFCNKLLDSGNSVHLKELTEFLTLNQKSFIEEIENHYMANWFFYLKSQHIKYKEGAYYYEKIVLTSKDVYDNRLIVTFIEDIYHTDTVPLGTRKINIEYPIIGITYVYYKKYHSPTDFEGRPIEQLEIAKERGLLQHKNSCGLM